MEDKILDLIKLLILACTCAFTVIKVFKNKKQDDLEKRVRKVENDLAFIKGSLERIEEKI